MKNRIFMKKICCVFLCFIFTSQLYPQVSNPNIKLTLPQVTPITPDASSMVKFVSTPIDYSHGKINLTIPLYEIKVGDITLPITLSYNCDGLKPREASGRVGYGWILNAEPSVTRIVNGAPDDHDNYYDRLCGYKYESVGNIDVTLDSAYLRAMFEKRADQEPDKYAYQLINGGGTASIPRESKSFANPFPENYDKIFYADLPVIKDKNGLIYTMGGSDAYEEKNQNDIIRFMCSSIRSSKTAASITFRYIENEKTYVNPNLFNVVTVEDQDNMEGKILQVNNFNDNYSVSYEVLSNGLGNATSYANSNQQGAYTQSILKGKFIDEIKFDNGRVQFFWNNQILEMINVYNKNQDLIRYVQFYITPYNSHTELLKLDSVIIGAPGCELQSYKMYYNNDSQVPDSGTKGLDHWGYYNGTNPESTVPLASIQSFTPNSSVNHTIGSADKTSNGYFANYGMLSEISNSQGIRTTYTYEPNQTGYYPTSGTSDLIIVPVGGVHIRQIVDYNKNGQIYQSRLIDYLTRSSALSRFSNLGVVRKALITPDDYCLIQTKHQTLWNSNITKTTRLRTWASQPYSSITFEDGSVILYDSIVEHISTSLQTKYAHFKNVYSYRSPLLRPILAYYPQARNQAIPFEFDTEHKWYNYGQLLSVLKYRNDVLFKKTQYVYDEVNIYSNPYNLNTRKAYQTDILVGAASNSQNLNKYNYVDYDYPSYNLSIKQIIDTDYKLSGNISSVTDYFYGGLNNHANPTKMSMINSDGKIVETKYNYFEDFENFNENLNRDLLLENNVLTDPCEIKKVIGTDTIYQRIVFNQCKPAAVKTKMRSGSIFQTVLNYYYDSYGNINEVNSSDNKHICYIWSYNNQYPIAKIENVTYANLLSALSKDVLWIKTLGNKDSPALADMNLINSLRQNLPETMVTTYEYDPLIGLSSTTDPRGKKICYSFDKKNRLNVVFEFENNIMNILQDNKYHFGDRMSEDYPSISY